VDSLSARAEGAGACRGAADRGWCGSSTVAARGAFTPDEIERGADTHCSPLHGTGWREELLMKAYRDEAERRQARSWCRAP
jgi:hypothetical protein